MLLKLFLLFTIVPVIEIALLLKISRHIGLGYTILIVVATGLIGAYLAKREGKGIFGRIKFEMSQGRMPGDELINGLCVIIGGVCLITPGILTDILGLVLVIPYTRTIIKEIIKRKIRNMVREGVFTIYYRR